MNHVTVGVYKNGDYVINVVKEEHLEGHIEYNKIFRFGRALFVDGNLENQGYLTDEEVEAWKEKIKGFNVNINVASDVYH